MSKLMTFQDHEHLARRLTEAIPDGLYIFDVAAQRQIYSNPQLSRILGYSPQQMERIGSLFDPELIHPDDVSLIAEALNRLAAAGESDVVEVTCRLKHACGEWRWICSRLVVFARTAEGIPSQFLGTAQDVSKRKQAEQALRESEEKLRLIYENAYDGISIYEELPNKSRRLIDCNGRYAEMAGRSKEELLAIGNTSLVQKKVSPEMNMEEILRVRREKIPYHGLFSWLRPDGKENIIEYSAAPIQVGGRPLTIGLDRDITERKKLEDRLRQLQKLEVVAQLAAGVAHNFNNLLTAILGYAGLALAQLESGHPVQADLKGIQKTAQRAAKLTQQLLAFTRRQVVFPRRVNLNKVVADIEPLLRHLVDEIIELEIHPAGDAGWVKIDPSQVEQILINLVVNARDAMPSGGKIFIEVANFVLDQEDETVDPELAPGDYVTLTVRDMGMGMDEKVKEHLFEPFFTTKEVGQGTGLGLSTCFGIVKQNQGYISVISEMGQGTTVKVYLPRLELE